MSTTTVRSPSRAGRLGLGAEAALLARSRLTVLELVLCAVFLLSIGVAAFGSHVREGGFYSDDWAIAGEYRAAVAEGGGLWAALEQARGGGLFAFRPVLALALAVPHALFGLDARLHLALAVALGALTSLCLYALLRTLAMERLHAAVIAALVLLFPWSDATRLWATASVNNVAVCFYLVGTLLALRGLREHGARAIRLHAGAVALYVLSVLTYEVAAVAILGSGLLYAAASGRRAALRRWPWDVAATGAALAWVGANTPRELRPPGELVARAATFFDEGLSVLAGAALPVGAASRLAVLGGIVAVLALAAVVRHGLPAADPARAVLARWLIGALAGAGVIVAGYGMFVPGEDHYSPLKEGLSNRVNVLAALGHVLLVYSVAVLAATLAARTFRGGAAARALYVALPALAAAALALGYADEVRAHEVGYARTTAFQQRLLGLIQREVRAPRGATIYTFGHPTYTAPGVAAFRHWDLKGAVRVVLDDSSLDAYPIYPGVGWACGRARMHPRSRFYSREQSISTYGKGVWVDFVSGRAVLVRDREQCRALSRRFRPGTWS